MLYDRDGKMLWIADETGGFEILQPGPGYNGRTREPGEPDWWVVAKDPGWQPPGALLAAAPEEGSPLGGSFDLGSGAPDWDSSAKIAGRKEPAEPWSVLSATQEHLDHIDRVNGLGDAAQTRSMGFGEAVETIGKGVGEAVTKGAAGAAEAVDKGWNATGTALGKTWDALTTNEDLRKGVEFGGKAALEVTKDVAWEAGKDAAMALGGYWFKDTGKESKVTDAFGTAGGLISKGIRLYDKAPDWGRGLGERLNKIKDDVYSKE